MRVPISADFLIFFVNYCDFLIQFPVFDTFVVYIFKIYFFIINLYYLNFIFPLGIF